MAFKMKGSSLYGKINLNRGGQASRPDGRAKSSAFQASNEEKFKAVGKSKGAAGDGKKKISKGTLSDDEMPGRMPSDEMTFLPPGTKKKDNTKKKDGAPMKNDLRKTKGYKKAVKTEREMYAKDNRKKRSKTFTGRITNKIERVIKKGVKKVKSKVGVPMKKSPMEKAGGFDEVVEGFKTIGRKLKPSVKNVKQAGSDIKEGFRQLFTGDRTDSRTKKKKPGAPMAMSKQLLRKTSKKTKKTNPVAIKAKKKVDPRTDPRYEAQRIKDAAKKNKKK